MKSLFRQEALAEHERGEGGGDVLRFEKRWVRIVFPMLVACAIAGVFFICIASVDEYASGPAVVRVEGRRMIVATSPGSVEALDVKPGDSVEANAPVARMRDADERAELARVTSEYELALVRQLADPNDAVARTTLAALRSRREQARNAVDARLVRAPISGVVSDVRVRAGQAVTPGEVLLALVPKDAQNVSLVAMVPADYRPMLRNGLEMRFELDGFRFEYADVKVEEVSAEAVGPAEVARFLGSDRADAVRLDPGGKVFLSAKLPASTFTSEGQPYSYFDGLTGSAEVRVRREPLVVTLIPALRQVLR